MIEFSYSSQFKKRFKKLPIWLQKQVGECLALFVQDEFHPLLNNHKLQGKYETWRSINITGDFRVIFKKVSDQFIRIDAVGTHDELYG